MPRGATQVSGRAHCMAARPPRLGHRDLAPHPGASMLDRLARPRVLRLGRLEEVEDVLCTRGGPEGEGVVTRVGKGPTAADCHEARVSDLRKDHGWHSFCSYRPLPKARTRDQARPQVKPQTRWSIGRRAPRSYQTKGMSFFVRSL